ncbi:Crp/Fnr family transcriptional regulator [Corallincola holothuriorum]|uniref:Crp/Fnr family transcriptional regulator n=1 Tax=Corallincola holothuriorum TaxID=2282215 RepID=A0A368N536_9GAMM|nr:Crp/Fnr family transcriptional regulator [Corallincola holothuriorum]RCU45290.1 Crp/Fnr family transcriptional regulator [Corallincola holothuriorum]
MTQNEMIELLHSLAVFKDLSHRQHVVLAKYAVIEEIPAGEILISDGVCFDRLSLILAGKVGYYRQERGAAESLVMESYQSYFVGIFGLLFKRSPGVKARVLEPVKMLSLQFEHIAFFEKNEPAIALALYKNISMLCAETILRVINK